MAESESLNVLITGFGPFAEHTVNASWETVSALPEKINGFKIIKEQVPVIYEHIETNIPKMWELYNPKLVVHVGVSSLTDKIQIESCARRTGYERKDIDNKCPAEGTASCGNDDGNEFIQTNLCTKTICDKLNEFPTLAAAVSDNPGRYLCEFIYYTSLNINNNGTLFVHVPPLDKPFSKKQLVYALEEVIKCALGLIAKNDKRCVCFPTTIYKNGRAAAF